MASGNGFLGTEDEGNGLVDDRVIEKEHALVFFSVGTCAALYEIDGAPEGLLRIFGKSSGDIDISLCGLRKMLYDIVHIEGLTVCPDKSDVILCCGIDTLKCCS